MCQSLKDGGKRCAAHMNGSRAIFKEAKVSTGADEGLLRKVFNFLRGEGKDNAAPTEAEVQEFADKKAVEARFDPELDNRSRNMLIRNWGEARNEKPDGGVFHAWKNLTSKTTELMTKIKEATSRKTAVAFMVAGSVAITGACGANANDDTPEPTQSSPTAEEVDEREPFKGEIDFALPSGFSEGEKVSDSNGEYTKLSLDEDSELMTFDKDKVIDDAVYDHYSEEELADGQRFASTFVVEEVIDSPLMYDYSEENAKAWGDRNVPEFTSSIQDEIRDNLMDTEKRTVVTESNSAWDRGAPVYDGGVRHGDLDVSLVSISSLEKKEGAVKFEYSISYNNPVFDEDNPDDLYVETSDHGYRVSIERDTSKDNNWALAGIASNFTNEVRQLEE